MDRLIKGLLAMIRSAIQHRLEPPAGIVHFVEEQAEFRQLASEWAASIGHQPVFHESVEAFFSATHDARPSCLVLDLLVGRASGLEIQARFTRENRVVPVVFVASRADVRSAVTAMEQGAVTVLERPCERDHFIEAVSEAISRDAMGRRLTQRMEELRRRFDNLSDRERLVMQLVVEGRLNKAIARELKMTERTVERVRAVVLDKVGAESAVQMASLLTEHRLLGELLCGNCPSRVVIQNDFVVAT